MNIELNGETKVLEKEVTLVVFLEDLLKEKMTGLAVAINGSVIPKTKWETTSIKNEDRVELVRATQGG